MSVWGQAWSSDEGVDAAYEVFGRAFSAEPASVWSAPGRVNLIGEHTDYNGGLCLPIALPHRTFVAASPTTDRRVRLATDLTDETWEGSLADIRPGEITGWPAYTAGPAWSLREEGIDVPGFDLAVASCVPLGAGLSSSAALACAVGLALADLAGAPLDSGDTDRARLADICVRAENEVAGAPTGGMDQAASLRCRAGHALLLDCLDGSVEHVPLALDDAGLRLLVIDTRAPHALSDGRYGQRRATCEAAALQLGMMTLREISDLDSALARLDDEVSRRRVRHVVTEIDRVQTFATAARTGDWTGVGAFMNASHESLRDDYEVSCTELDVAVESAIAAGALGARMTGGGFGGSAIALTHARDTDTIAEAVLHAASDRDLPTPHLHLAVPSAAGGRH